MALVGHEIDARWKDQATSKMGKIKSIRVYVFLATLIVSLAPMIVLLYQAEKTSFAREVEHVEQGHLVIAKNLATALDRYAVDVVSTFDFLVESGRVTATDGWTTRKLTAHYGLRYLSLMDANGLVTPLNKGESVPTLSPTLQKELRQEAFPGKTVLSGVKLLEGAPHLFAIRSLSGGKIAFAALDTNYLQKVQKAIAFGERGHSMIVDAQGRVLAHPKAEWQASAKDASGLEVVRKMIGGQTGVMQFYSPPMKADVIAGYTFVPSTGWGVMVPQPVSELKAAARSELESLIVLLAFLAVLAATGGWILSGLITKPIQIFKDTVTQILDGRMDARVPQLPSSTTKELEDCRTVFNGLMDKLSSDADTLKQSLDLAEEAVLAKTRFIAVLSHEMRTPLNGIIATLDLLEGTKLDKEQQQYMQLLEVSSSSLKRHVDEVLDVNTLKFGETCLDQTVFSLPLFLERIVLENEATATEQGNEIELTVSSDLPEFVRTDENKLERIVTNLVGNAVKFTDRGTISISAEMSEGSNLLLSVADTGIGISDEDLERIFQPFTTLDSRYARSREGTGLGLSIVEGFVDALGGEVIAESILGEGSVFQMTVPVETLEEAATPASAQSDNAAIATEQPTFSGHVLVVEDNHVNTIVLRKLLTKMGLEVTAAADGFEALEVVKREVFDLILMDISMPGMDGTEVTKIIRNNEGPNRETPIIAQTAHAMPAEREAFSDAGMQAVLIKPISRKDLTDMMNARADFREFQDQQKPEASNVGAELNIEKFEEVIELVGADEAGNLIMSLAAGVAEVVEKLETDWAVRREGEELAALAHKTAGTCAVLGAVSLRQILVDIQYGARDGSLKRIAILVKELLHEMHLTDAQMTVELARLLGAEAA